MSSAPSPKALVRKKGRLASITLVCLSLFFGASGFIPMAYAPVNLTQQDRPTDTGVNLMDQLTSYNAHNLLVDREEMRCLALNIYWESRSESLEGQIAVAAVTLNRVASEKFPSSICGVVKQGAEWRKYRCQFSWWCDGLKDTPKERQAWMASQQLARLVLNGKFVDPTDGALWYHADYVSPDWANRMDKTVKIGRHIFYVAMGRQSA